MPHSSIHAQVLSLATFLDAPPVAHICVGVVGGFLLFMALQGLTASVQEMRRLRPAHVPRRGRRRPVLPKNRVPRDPRHRVEDLTQAMTAYPYPAYLGPVDNPPAAPAARPVARERVVSPPPCTVCGRRTHERRPAMAASGGGS